ncbi:MAG TPA: M20/M25/M40 family metallo-hydrolase, partial [Candidatus Eisenbacteria bacterium]|nr:M20/M25/M40 family metallo-hydrolase [Candidatus Eisenbacteria bacterium]
TGTPGAEAAAEWIASQFRRFGLEPGGDQGTYLETFSAEVGIGYGSENALELTGVRGVEKVQMDKDYRPLASSENGSTEATLVFAGYGITVPSLAYDDYEGVDVKDKFVIVLRHQPERPDTSSAFSKLDPATYTSIRAKLKNAKAHGAAGLILVTGPASPDAEADKLITPRWKEAVGGTGILAVHMKRRVAESILKSAGIDLNQWVKDVDQTKKPKSAFLGDAVKAELEVEVKKDRRETANVVGILRGADPEAGAIVLGAHYDHLGRGNESSLAPSKIGEIHNGADDNASGTSGLVELARVMSSGPRPKRTIVFAAFSGEELGLLGASHMVEDPPIALDQIEAMLNMDMIGRPKNRKVLVGGVGTSPAFPSLLERAAAGRGVKVEQSKGVASASDHEEFYQKSIPVLFFFSGLHEDYHKPGDDWQKIDREGITEITKIVWSTAMDLAGSTEDVQFVKAEEEKDPHSSGTGGGFGAYFGSIPDYGAQERGVKLAGVKEASPAEKAGLKEGDVIVRFAGREIVDIYDYTDAIKEHKPGDTVDVVVMREGKEVAMKATLATRD